MKASFQARPVPKNGKYMIEVSKGMFLSDYICDTEEEAQKWCDNHNALLAIADEDRAKRSEINKRYRLKVAARKAAKEIPKPT